MSDVHKIKSKITGYSVSSADKKNQSEEIVEQVKPQQMNENIARGESLSGKTYKIDKSPASEHAIYVTINDIVLNEGTSFETRQPFEIFINSKNMDNFQWVVAMTRIMSAVFRKGGDVAFIVEEMKSVFDPHGGYFRKGNYIPSLVAEIGKVVETHLQGIGLIAGPELSAAQKELIASKLEKIKESNDNQSSFPANATFCNKCNNKSMVLMDGCQTCLNCGNSKCG